jgi:Domain of Unknown Function (DUF1080)
MRTRSLLAFVVAAVFASTLFGAESKAAKADSKGWTRLFNGKDLTGWEKFLSYQPESGSKEILGVDQDPEGVISVVDGSVHILGKTWGALTSKQEFENFHLRLEFKWGEARWGHRKEAKRDSGILYYAVGPHGAQADHWMRSIEMQVQEGDCGDYYSLDGVMIDVEAQKVEIGGGQQWQYTPGAEVARGVKQRVVKRGEYEKPHGEWNVLEVIAQGGSVTHIVNGETVLRATNARQVVAGQEVPLTRGKIQLQSEGAEVYYRNIEVQNLK